MKLKKLYSRRSDGGLQSWEMEVVKNQYRVHSGIEGGKIVTNAWTTCEGKNIGRSNETTPEEQAKLEAQATWQKKYNSGYRETEAELTSTGIFEPMLAKKYVDYSSKVTFPVWCQPKLDGIRCIAKKDGLYTRNGKKHTNLDHIYTALKPIFDKYPGLVLDGEGYADKLNNDFSEILHLIKQVKPTEKDRADSAAVIKYHVYDCYFDDKAQLPFQARQALLEQLVGDISCIQVVETRVCTTQEELDMYYAKWLEAGYEGQMIRSNTEYENKRTIALLKRKEFVDEEFTILDVEEGVGNRAGTAGALVLANERGAKFNASLRGNKAYVTELLKKKKEIIGQQATVRYQNLTNDNIPRFPVAIAVRTYE